MDIDQKDLAYHYHQAIKLVNDLIDFYFDLLANHHLANALNCKQVSVIKAKSIEINLLRKSGYQYDDDELFKLCETIFAASLQVYYELVTQVNSYQIMKNNDNEPSSIVNCLIELHDLINNIKYLEAQIGIVHNYDKFFTSQANVQKSSNKTNSSSNEKSTSSNSLNQVDNQARTHENNQANVQLNNQMPNPNEKTDHLVRMQAKQVEQWLLNHFPSRQEYMDWSFQLKTIQNKINELEQLIKTKKKPN